MTGATADDEYKGWVVPSGNSDALAEELNQWQQGDLIFDLPVSWIAPVGEDPATEIFNSASIPAYPEVAKKMTISIVCSQTCDVGGDSESHPYFLVAPVVPASSIHPSETLNNAQAGKVMYLYPVSLPSEVGTGEFFVDFRMITSASKTLLKGRTPVAVFYDDKARSDFAEALAFKFRRPAINTTLLRYLSSSLKKMVALHGGGGDLIFEYFEQIRIIIFAGTATVPEQIQAVVFHGKTASDGERKVWDDWAVSVRDEMKNSINVDLGPIIYSTEATMKIQDYRKTFPLRIPNLRGKPRW